MNVYFLSGLGADSRAFSKLRLSEKLKLHYIDWISPFPKERLSAYAKRLLPQINTQEPFMLVGLSFGGLVAIELNKFIHPEKTIIISSIAKRSQMPPQFRHAGSLGLIRLLPFGLLTSSNFITHFLFGTKTKKEKELLAQILKDTDPGFLKWAIQQITTWKNKSRIKNLFHIHGSADRIFPIMFMKPDYTVKGGGHWMIQRQSKEIGEVLNKELLLNLPIEQI